MKQDTPPSASTPVFVTGSTLRHVLVMTGTASIGLMAVFSVDLLSLFYISRLGNPSLTAAVGYASVVFFFAISINIGLMIALTALVSRALGANQRERARQIAGSACTHTVCVSIIAVIGVLAAIDPILSLLGATGETHAVARQFLTITMPSNIFMALGMAFSGVLRAVGDAKRAMWVTLIGGLVTAVLDPLLIFGAGLGVEGAAIASSLSRFLFAVVGFWGAVHIHKLVARPKLSTVLADIPLVATIAAPAILTNVATPVANAFFTSVIARFGDEAVAATAVIDRLTPVAFGALFALSGAIGPILGQNWGAKRFDRMREAFGNALTLTAVYVCTVGLVLGLGRGFIANAFQAKEFTADLVMFFCLVSGVMWLFNGCLFISNAAFNNLGFPLYSTLLNWGKSTLGTVPFALIGARLNGAHGAFIGIILGGMIFGIAAVLTAYRAFDRLERANL